jgi:hypothetical protein
MTRIAYLSLQEKEPLAVTSSAKRRLIDKGTDRARDGVDLKNDMA